MLMYIITATLLISRLSGPLWTHLKNTLKFVPKLAEWIKIYALFSGRIAYAQRMRKKIALWFSLATLWYYANWLQHWCVLTGHIIYLHICTIYTHIYICTHDLNIYWMGRKTTHTANDIEKRKQNWPSLKNYSSSMHLIDIKTFNKPNVMPFNLFGFWRINRNWCIYWTDVCVRVIFWCLCLRTHTHKHGTGCIQRTWTCGLQAITSEGKPLKHLTPIQN